MGKDIVEERPRRLTEGLLVGVLMMAILWAAPAAQARPRPSPTIVLSSAANLAPDGQSVTIEVVAACPERWTVLEASVTVTQPQASGKGHFPLQCIGALRPFSVTVRSLGTPFRLGDAQVSGFVLIQRGRTEQTRETATIRLLPTVFVDLSDTAHLDAGGDEVVVDVTVACPVGAIPQESQVNVGQPQAAGQGLYMPICDGGRHAFAVRVAASTGRFQPGPANAGAIALVVDRGDGFYGADLQTISIV